MITLSLPDLTHSCSPSSLSFLRREKLSQRKCDFSLHSSQWNAFVKCVTLNFKQCDFMPMCFAIHAYCSDTFCYFKQFVTLSACDFKQVRLYSVFLDVAKLLAGHFDTNLIKNVQWSRHFVLILSPNALDRCIGDHELKIGFTERLWKPFTMGATLFQL